MSIYLMFKLYLKHTFCILFVVTFCSSPIRSQENHHSHARNEFGVSPGAIYSPTHNSWGFALHAHYFRTLGEHSRWALGVGAEKAFLHGGHWTVGVGARYHILDDLSVAIMPGITFLGHDEHEGHEVGDKKERQAKFSAHFEVTYDLIHLKHFHFGPSVDYSWSKGDSHFMLGVHCAYMF